MNSFKEKTVLITGHTGFKGSWLSMWLVHLGAKVAEVSNNEISEPSIFLVSEISSVIDDYQLDVRDADAIKVLVEKKSA